MVGAGLADGLVAAAIEADTAAAASTSAVAAGDSVSPSTPVGRSGGPLTLARPKDVGALNEPTTIMGRDYTGHALDQMQARGVSPSPAEDAIENGDFMAGKRAGTSAYYSPVNNITIIIDTESGRVITVVTGLVKQ